MFVTQADYESHREELGTRQFNWILKQNDVPLVERYEILTARGAT